MSTTARMVVVSSSNDSFSRQRSLRPNLRASVLDAGFFGLMVGIGEAYLPAFALAIGLGEVVAGLVTSVPILIGGFLQLFSLYALPWVGSYKRWIVTGIALQAIAFLPLIYAAFTGSISATSFFVVASCYWGAGMAAGPAWNAWISHVVPMPIRARYFARRTRTIQLSTLGGFLIGGGLLYATKNWGIALVGFATLFIIACCSRFISALFIECHRTSEEDDFAAPRVGSVWQAWRTASPKIHFLIMYLICMQACIQFSGPYFIPYMLKQLHYGYEVFVCVFAGAFIARAVFMSVWGIVARRYGAQALLGIGGIGLIPLSMLWIVSDAIPWLIFIQVLAGALWSAYELAFFLMFLEYIPQRKRADMLTIYNFANSVALCCGAMAGGWWITSHGMTVAAYHGAFLLSAVGRIGCVVLLWLTWRSSSLAPQPSWPKSENRESESISDSRNDFVPAPVTGQSLASPLVDAANDAA